MALWRGWHGTLKRAVWYFEDGGMALWRGWYGTFEEGGVVLWRWWYGTLKRVVWYFEEGGVVLWRGWCGTILIFWNVVILQLKTTESISNTTDDRLLQRVIAEKSMRAIHSASSVQAVVDTCMREQTVVDAPGTTTTSTVRLGSTSLMVEMSLTN